MINEMTGLNFECTEAEVASGRCIYQTGRQVLETFGLPYGETGASQGGGIAAPRIDAHNAFCRQVLRDPRGSRGTLAAGSIRGHAPARRFLVDHRPHRSTSTEM